MYYLAVNRLKKDAVPEVLGRAVSEHVEWTLRQIEAGTLVQAGRWGEAGGVAIIRASSEAAARTILDEDPLWKSGQITVELARFFPDTAIAHFD